MIVVNNKSIYILRVIKKELQIDDLYLEMQKKRMRTAAPCWEMRN